jgi:hypothetical protein
MHFEPIAEHGRFKSPFQGTKKGFLNGYLYACHVYWIGFPFLS